MNAIPTIAPPHPDPRAPDFVLPPRTCDSHCHIFGPDSHYPYAADRPYTPPDAPLEMLRALQARLRIERAVIVNATPYGRDNTVILDAIAQSGGRYRGIANVDVRMTQTQYHGVLGAHRVTSGRRRAPLCSRRSTLCQASRPFLSSGRDHRGFR